MSNTPDYITPDGEEIYEHEMEDRTEELITNCHELLTVGYMTFEAGRVVRELDPIAFRQCVVEEIDSLMQDEELDEWREDHPWRDLPEPADNAPEGALDVWLKILDGEEEAAAEANIYLDGQHFTVKWYPTATGQVTEVPFLTYQGARGWLEGQGFEDYSA